MRNLKTVNWKFVAHKYFRLHGPRTYVRLVWRFLQPVQTWEPQVWKAIKSVKGDLFVDVGANQGVYAIGLRKNFRKIIAIEPRPDTVEMLRKNIRGNKKVIVWQVALCEFNGETTLYMQDPPSGTMGVLDNRPHSGSADSIEREFRYRPASMPKIDKQWIEDYAKLPNVIVGAQRLDSLVNQQIDLLKIDVEGAEFRVLEGAKKLLSSHMIKHAIVELHDREMKRDLEEIFLDAGCRIRWVDPDHLYAERR